MFIPIENVPSGKTSTVPVLLLEFQFKLVPLTLRILSAVKSPIVSSCIEKFTTLSSYMLDVTENVSKVVSDIEFTPVIWKLCAVWSIIEIESLTKELSLKDGSVFFLNLLPDSTKVAHKEFWSHIILSVFDVIIIVADPLVVDGLKVPDFPVESILTSPVTDRMLSGTMDPEKFSLTLNWTALPSLTFEEILKVTVPPFSSIVPFPFEVVVVIVYSGTVSLSTKVKSKSVWPISKFTPSKVNVEVV